jgi:hypothetical protein
MPNPLEYDEESDTGDGLFGSDDEDKGCDDIDDILPDTRIPVVPATASTPTSVSLSGASTSQTVVPTGLPNPDQRFEELRQQRTLLDHEPSTGIPSLKWLTMRGE